MSSTAPDAGESTGGVTKAVDKPVKPMNLLDLLRALEKSRDLRSVARECGLSVRELRRRLALWRKELEIELSQSSPALGKDSRGTSRPSGSEQKSKPSRETWPELTPADQINGSPLPKKGSRVLEIWTDGASKGNPGPAAIGIVFGQRNGELLCSHAEVIGRATNNVAEYHAVVRALEHCARWKIKRVVLHLDSELIARQLTGVYRVKSPDLRPLYQRVTHLMRDLKSFRIRHIPRENNRHADFLANQAFSTAS
jgi:ribonuclease HI